MRTALMSTLLLTALLLSAGLRATPAQAEPAYLAPCMDNAEILSEAQQVLPLRHDQLLDIYDDNPARFSRLIHQTWQLLLADPVVIQANNALFAAQARFKDDAAAWRAAPQEQRPLLEQRLAAAASEVLEARERVLELRSDHLQRELLRVQAEIQDQQMNWDLLVEEKLRAVTGD